MNKRSKQKFQKAMGTGSLYKITGGNIPAVIQTERHKTSVGIVRAISFDSLTQNQLRRAKKIT